VLSDRANRDHHRPSPKVILLFDQDGHPAVPTCASRAGARSGSQGWPKATAKRRLASLTDASTTAPSRQKDDKTTSMRHIAVYLRILTAANTRLTRIAKSTVNTTLNSR
jgi:hypothetical protein